jgi:hypothetical protein
MYKGPGYHETFSAYNNRCIDRYNHNCPTKKAGYLLSATGQLGTSQRRFDGNGFLIITGSDCLGAGA